MEVQTDLMQAILNYLVTKPFIEVNQLVQEILKLQQQNGVIQENVREISNK